MRVRYHRYTHDRTFRSAKHFADYAEKQASKFESLRESNANAYSWWASTVANHWKAAASAGRHDPQAAQRSLDRSPAFPFESRLTKLLLEMTEQGRQAAARQIINFLTGHIDGQYVQSMSVGEVTAHAEFRLALALEKQSGTARDEVINRLIEDHETRLASVLEADETRLQEQRAAYDDFLETAQNEFENLKSSADDLILQARHDWNETHASFMEQLATETAVELWEKRAKEHKKRYESFRGWALGFGIGGLIIGLVWIFSGFALAKIVFSDDKTAQIASYTAGTIALFTLLVWGLRVLIRSMMSEDHLATDASARSALAHTYLALTKEKAATENDRAIILAALFAPVSDGLVKDDGMPTI